MRATIKMKLGTTFGILVAMMLILAGVGISRMNALNTAITDLVAGPARSLYVAQSIDSQVSLAVRAEKNLALTSDDTQMKEFNQRLDDARATGDDLIKEALRDQGAYDKGIWDRVKTQWEAFKIVNDQVRGPGPGQQECAGRRAVDRCGVQGRKGAERHHRRSSQDAAGPDAQGR